jgi:hypothetical protein
MMCHCGLIFKVADAIEVPFESLKLMGPSSSLLIALPSAGNERANSHEVQN